MIAVTAQSQPASFAGKSEDAFEFTDGVVVDLGDSTAYLMNPRQGIDAVNLQSGKLLWQTTEAARPLVLHDGSIIAQAESGSTPNTLSLVVLSTRDEGNRLSLAEFTLPQIVQVSVADGPETSFRVTGRAQGESVLVRWRYTWQPVDGPPPAPGEQAVSLDGALWIEPSSGRHGIIPPDSSEEKNPGVGEEVQDRVEELIASSQLSGSVWLTDGVLATIERTADGNSRLRRWQVSPFTPLPDVDLSEDGFSYRYVSADLRHALVSRRAGANTGDWLWRLYSLQSGQRVAALRQSSAATRFFLTQSHLIQEAAPGRRPVGGGFVQEPRRLRAIDLQTARESWTMPLRDATYRGPQPPG